MYEKIMTIKDITENTDIDKYDISYFNSLFLDITHKLKDLNDTLDDSEKQRIDIVHQRYLTMINKFKVTYYPLIKKCKLPEHPNSLYNGEYYTISCRFKLDDIATMVLHTHHYFTNIFIPEYNKQSAHELILEAIRLMQRITNRIEKSGFIL